MVFNLCLPLILPLPVHQPAAATVAVPFLGCRLQWDEAGEVLPVSSCTSHPKRTRKLQLGLPTEKKVDQNRYTFFTSLSSSLKYICALFPFRDFTFKFFTKTLPFLHLCLRSDEIYSGFGIVKCFNLRSFHIKEWKITFLEKVHNFQFFL